VVILMFVAPTEFKVERSISIQAPKELVKEQVVYFKNSQKWSPWAKLDPNMKEWFEGEDGTVGAKHFWDGNDSVGEGSQEIMAIEENRVETLVTFIRPFESKANGYFVFEENDNATTVTWGFESKIPRPFNIIGLFMDISENVGKDYEKGLESLKIICEAKAEEMASKWNIETVEFSEKTFLTYRDTVGISEMQEFYSNHLGAIFGYLSSEKDLQPAGPACGIYYAWDEENQMTVLAAAVPYISNNNKKAELKGYEPVTLSGNAYKLAYIGNYNQLSDAHRAIHEYIEANNYAMSDVVLEEYVTDPGSEPDTSKWITNIYYFAK
jgi:effector-binding domain-containing protein